MNNRNDYDYFDLDNFDDSYDSRDYRRRSNRGNGSYNRRPVKRRNTKRIRNRIIIISSLIIILAVIIFIVSLLFKGCTDSAQQALAAVSTETVSKTSVSTDDSAQPDKSASDLTFVTPQIDDDNTNGEMVYNIYVWHNTGFEIFSND